MSDYWDWGGIVERNGKEERKGKGKGK